MGGTFYDTRHYTFELCVLTFLYILVAWFGLVWFGLAVLFWEDGRSSVMRSSITIVGHGKALVMPCI